MTTPHRTRQNKVGAAKPETSATRARKPSSAGPKPWVIQFTRPLHDNAGLIGRKRNTTILSRFSDQLLQCSLSFRKALIMHHGPVFANEESVRAGDGEVVGALDAVGDGDFGDRQAAVIGGFDPLAGGEGGGFDPALTLNQPGMIVGDEEDFRLSVRVPHFQPPQRLRVRPDQRGDGLRACLAGVRVIGEDEVADGDRFDWAQPVRRGDQRAFLEAAAGIPTAEIAQEGKFVEWHRQSEDCCDASLEAAELALRAIGDIVRR